MLNLIIFGAPGSGKGTQSDLLKEKYGLCHISTGDVLRAKIKSRTELGLKAESFISKGQLIPDSLMIDILAKVMSDQTDVQGFILDGFPRTLPQAEALKVVLEEKKMELSAVIALEVEEGELMQRLVKRGEVSGRADDNEEVIKSRLKVYHNQTFPLIDYYKQEGKYHGVKGEGSVQEIFGRITAEIDAL